MSVSPYVIDGSDAEFEKLVLEGSKERPVVVDFWAPWCRPCLQLGPVLERLVDAHQGAVLLVKLNIDENPKAASRYFVESIPAVKAFRNGEVILEFVGLLPETHLQDFLKRIIPSEADKQVVQAQAMEESVPEKAEAIYRAILEQNPDHEESRIGLARVLLKRGADAEASDWLEPLGPGSRLGSEVEQLKAILELRQQAGEQRDVAALQAQVEAEPKNLDLQLQLGRALAANGQFEKALEVLLAIAQADSRRASSQVRPLMVQVFHALGVRHPLSDEYRAKLTQLLY